MKKTIIALIIFSFLSCKAQIPMIERYGSSSYGTIENAYYKDLQNFHDQYVGTWLYTNGATSLKVVLIKKPMFHVLGGPKTFYEDLLIGEYQYIENGVEKVNTLNNLSNNNKEISDYNLYSITQTKRGTNPKCPECGADEKRLMMNLNEPSRRYIENGISNEFDLRKLIENGVEKLKVQFVYTGMGGNYSITGEKVYVTNYSLPYGDYTLIKQ